MRPYTEGCLRGSEGYRGDSTDLRLGSVLRQKVSAQTLGSASGEGTHDSHRAELLQEVLPEK